MRPYDDLPNSPVAPCGSAGFVAGELGELWQRAPQGFGGPLKVSRGHRRQRINPLWQFTARKHSKNFSYTTNILKNRAIQCPDRRQPVDERDLDPPHPDYIDLSAG